MLMYEVVLQLGSDIPQSLSSPTERKETPRDLVVVTVGSEILQDVSCLGQLNSPVKSQEEDVQSCVITIITSCTLHERHPSFVQVLNDPTQNSHTCTFFSQHSGQWWEFIVCVLGHHSSFSLLVNGLWRHVASISIWVGPLDIIVLGAPTRIWRWGYDHKFISPLRPYAYYLLTFKTSLK